MDNVREAEDKVDELIYRITHGGGNDPEEWFALQDDITAFFSSDAPESEKKRLGGYTECVSMACEGFRHAGIVG